MDPERWQTLQDIFEAALDLPADERPAYLSKACGTDLELRREVESLLEADVGSDSFIGSWMHAVREGAAAGAALTLPRKIGKYDVIRQVGQGGFGTVYEGRDPDLRRPVAIKACRNLDADRRRRFLREAQIAATLRHRNITLIHDLGADGEVSYLVQEYLPGRDLSELIAEGALPTRAKLDLLVQVAEGLAHAHERGVLHRDVKPSNVRVLRDGTAKILDFGVARWIETEGTRLTRTGALVGTVGYVSPEQMRGEATDPRSDVFGFGVLAYELLSGLRPFPGETFAEVSYQLLWGSPEPLGEVWPESPDRRLPDLVARCLEKWPDRRWRSMEEVAQTLRDIRETLGQGRHQVDRASSRRRAVLGAALAGPVLLVILVLGLPKDPVDSGSKDGGTLDLPAVSSPEQRPPPASETERTPEVASDRASQASERASTPPPPPPSSPPSPLPVPEDERVAAPVEATADLSDPVTSRSAPVPVREEPEPGEVVQASLESTVQSVQENRAMRRGDVISKAGPGVVPPRIREYVEPEYPRRAQRRRQEANVIVAVYVDENGRVIDTFLKQKDGTGAGFDEAARAAAAATVFEPATRDGIAGRMWTEIPYQFRLRR